MQMESNLNRELATLGGGCFWCLEPIFEELSGVENVVVGYAGGQHPDPNYQMVCTGTTGHAEVIQVDFDPAMISFEEILGVFFNVHDPTLLNRQGADVGTQYRSIILYHDDQQREVAESLIAELDSQKAWNDPIVTQVEALATFFPAEDYHQGYFRKNPDQGYCRVAVAPKLEKFRQKYLHRLKQA